MKFVGRFSGLITYSDNTKQQFAAHVDERGNVSVNSGIGDTPNESNQAILEVQNANNWLEEMLALVSGSLALAPLGAAGKTVTDAVMHFSGRVARDNNTTEDFAVQYDRKADGNFVLNSSGAGSTGSGPGSDTTPYAEFTASTLTAWFGALVGDAQVTAP
jgi:hypothetical protein